MFSDEYNLPNKIRSMEKNVLQVLELGKNALITQGCEWVGHTKEKFHF